MTSATQSNQHLLPGPEAQQLATYIGWLLHRTAGGLVAGILFVLPGFVAGVLASVLANRVTFVPCFLWIFLRAPYVESLRGNTSLSAALSSITAAVVGVVFNFAIWFALHVSFAEVKEVRVALVAMLRFKLGMIPTLLGAAALGVTYFCVTA